MVFIIAACKDEEKNNNETTDNATSNEDAKSAYQLAGEEYLSKVDVEYSYNFTKGLEEFKTNEKLGYRTAGSEAEILTGNKIYEEMKKIGLEDVTRDEITLDTWTFEKAELSFKDVNGDDYNAVLGAYQVNFNTNGVKEFEVIYAGKGTKDDLANLDIEGKFLLVDINQRDEWWINYPAMQAHFKGAAGIFAVQEAGYSEVDPDALNAQDFCGPDDAPAFSMSQTDANVLKEAIKANGNEAITVNFDAKSTVNFDGKTYNYHGKIIGKDPESYIIYSAHYDSYFTGFQDDHAAIGLMMGIAKGLIDSGYQPEKTIIFNALAAEEWGVSNSRYDWSTGAYKQVFEARPEWAGKAVANINFELPAYEHTDSSEIRAVYELKNYLENFAKLVPAVDGVYKEGVSVVAPLRTWSDDYSFSLAGIPAMRNDFQDGEFMRTHYHSQFDTDETYNEKAFKFHHNLYGLLGIYYDQTAVVPLDFTNRLEALKEAVNKEIFANAGASSEQLIAQIDDVLKTVQTINADVKKVNDSYRTALNAGDAAAAEKLYDESRDLNAKLLAAFKVAQDQLVKLTWEDVQIFPHEHAQNNIENLTLAIEALNNGDVNTALDEYLWGIDNNWYAYDWDRDVFNYMTDYVLNQPADRLLWGYGRVVGHVDLYDVINSLKEKTEATNADVSNELKTLNEALQSQQQLLQTLVTNEMNALKAVQEALRK